MAGPRLPFLWPVLARGMELSNPAVRTARATARMRAFHTTPHRQRTDAVPQRYGTANEPPPHLGGGKGLGPSTNKQPGPEPQTALPKIGGQLQRDGEVQNRLEQTGGAHQDKVEQKQEPLSIEGGAPGPILSDPALDAAEAEVTEQPNKGAITPEEHPMESILQTVASPAGEGSQSSNSAATEKKKEKDEEEEEEEEDDDDVETTAETSGPPARPPHLDPPRHAHHFDTYGLVRQLGDAGWSNKQAITIMKAMRLTLAANIELAREALVSKSQVENETYLFRAACAELKTEVTGRRHAEQETLRSQRNQLQHELDILTQRLGQESGALKDELKGMFDDRKMAARNEQRVMESKIQRLNYQITVELQADGKSDVEGLRWVMTRRVIIALGVVVIMVLGSLKIYSNSVHEETEGKRKMAGKSNVVPPDFGPVPEGGDGAMLVQEGDNPAFVSLG